MNQKGPGVWIGLVVLGVLASAGARTVAAQNAVFRGSVQSERGEPLPGAIVYIAELNIIAPTTVEGKYVLTVPGARVRGQQLALRARAIGYKPGSQPVNLVPGDQSLDFSLGLDVHLLEAVVVTGVTGGTEQVKVPFATTRVDAAQMPVTAVNALTQLQGKVPGLSVKTTVGRPGHAPAVVIRGPKAINASGRGQEPLYIVDGVRINGNLPDINPQDIESVEIVRGAAGSSLYGSTAGSGVVQITTKSARGAIDQVQFHVRSEAGLSDIERDFGLARNHALLMDETNRFFCQSVAGQPLCARVFDYQTEAARVNNVIGDSARTPAGFPIDPGASTPATALRSQFQSKRYPGQTFNAVDQAVDPQPFYTNSIDMTGRFGSTSVFASVSNSQEGGAIRFLTGFERNSVRLNVDQRIGDAWSVAARTYYARSAADGANQANIAITGQGLTGNDAFFRLTRVPAIVNVLQRDTLGRLYIRPNIQASGAQNQNPLYPLESIGREDVSNRFIGGATVRYAPVEWLDVEGSIGYDGARVKLLQFRDKGYRQTTQGFAVAGSVGDVFRGDSSVEAINAGLSLTLRGHHLGGDLRSRVNLRYGYERQDSDVRAGFGNTLAVQGVTTLDNTTANKAVFSADRSERLIGIAGGVNLEFRERYIVDAVIRRDGSSLFGADNRWDTFGRLSLAWRPSQEPWWFVPQVSEFKLRGSYGTSGGRPRFDAQYETFTVGLGGIVSPVQLGNRNLGPERNTEVELGTDVELFSRLLINATYARSRTKDQILEVPVERASGFATQWRNAGTLLTTTYEMAARMPIIQRPNLTWSVGFIYDRNRTWIEKMNVAPFSYGSLSQATTTMFRAVEGERYGTFYGRKFLTSCSELPAPYSADCGGATSAFQVNDDGFLVWVGRGNSWRDGITRNLWQEALPAGSAPWGVGVNWGMPIILRDNTGAATTVPLGNSLPDFRFAITQNFQWKRLTVYALLDASIGQDVWNQGRHWAHLDFLAKEIDQEGKSVGTAKPIGYYWRAGPPDQAGLGGFYDLLAPNNRFVEDASYAKLRELLVSYHIGPLLGVGSWEVSIVGRNLFTLTDYKGFDPEVGQAGGTASSALLNAVDAFTFPGLRSFTIGLSTSF